MSHASIAQAEAHLKLIEAQGFTLTHNARAAIYEWSNGLPYHVQRLAAAIVEASQKTLDEPEIDRLADDIMLDDAFLSHIMRQLQMYPALARLVHKILSKPLKSSRNIDTIAMLEVIGIIHHDPTTRQWKITNQLCERFLRTYLVTIQGNSDVEQRSIEQVNPAVLRQMIATHFSDSELRDLCFDLAIDYENLPGHGKGDKVRELVAYVERYKRLAELVKEVRRLRPTIDWSNVEQPNPPEQ